MDSLVEFSWTIGSTGTMLVLPIIFSGVQIPDEPASRLGIFYIIVATPLTLLSQIHEAISKSDRANFKLGFLLDSPPLGTSDPRREFIDSHGKVQGISFKSSFTQSPNAVISRRNALWNHLYIHPRTLAHDLVVFRWLNLLIHELTAL
jgi:hypothetical protein